LIVSLVLGSAVLLVSSRDAGAAGGKINLVGTEISTTSGTEVLDIDGLGRCRDPIGFEVEFGPGRGQFSAEQDQGLMLSGKIKQSGPQGRKIEAILDAGTKRRVRSSLAGFIASCYSVGHVKVSLEDIDVRVVISKSLDTAKIIGRIEMTGEAGGDRGEGVYTFKASGPFIQ
jgi:hypothetical protein